MIEAGGDEAETAFELKDDDEHVDRCGLQPGLSPVHDRRVFSMVSSVPGPHGTSGLSMDFPI